MTAEIITTTDRTSMVTTEIDTQTPAKLRLRRKTPPAAGDKQFGRSSITNGKKMHLPPEAGDAAWGRRFKDIYNLLVADTDNEAARQQARRCATIALACEKLESNSAAGKEIDLPLYTTLTTTYGQAIQCLYDLKR
jgi:hypothetical protein